MWLWVQILDHLRASRLSLIAFHPAYCSEAMFNRHSLKQRYGVFYFTLDMFMYWDVERVPMTSFIKRAPLLEHNSTCHTGEECQLSGATHERSFCSPIRPIQTTRMLRWCSRTFDSKHWWWLLPSRSTKTRIERGGEDRPSGIFAFLGIAISGTRCWCKTTSRRIQHIHRTSSGEGTECADPSLWKLFKLARQIAGILLKEEMLRA